MNTNRKDTVNRSKETQEMDKNHRSEHVPVIRWGFVCAAAVITLTLTAAAPAEAQFNSGSSGIHGAFPPVPSGGMPSDAYFIVWNVLTGGVRYCSSYTVGTGSDQCNAGS